MRCGACKRTHDTVDEVWACYDLTPRDPASGRSTRAMRFCTRCRALRSQDHTHCAGCGRADPSSTEHIWCDTCNRCDSRTHDLHCSRCRRPEDHGGFAHQCRICGCSNQPCRHEVARRTREAASEAIDERLKRGEIYCRSCRSWSSRAGLHSNCQSQDWRAH